VLAHARQVGEVRDWNEIGIKNPKGKNIQEEGRHDILIPQNEVSQRRSKGKILDDLSDRRNQAECNENGKQKDDLQVHILFKRRSFYRCGRRVLHQLGFVPGKDHNPVYPRGIP
jgi:hypothetical protein